MKTASRIVGTSAFLAGYQAQDFPIYGAERRGAAIAAFTRIDEAPILERGMIVHPDLIVVGDETLLEDPTASVLAGQQSASAVFVNVDPTPGICEKWGIQPPLVMLDVTGHTVQTLGKASALSAGIAGAAAKLIGIISEEHLLNAVREELEHLGVPGELIEKNVVVARSVFSALEAINIRRTDPSHEPDIYRVGFDDPIRSTPSIFAAGNSEERHTGSWRVERPEMPGS